MRNNIEEKIQCAFTEILQWKYPKVLAWHTPNGGNRSITEAVRFKRMGVKRGVYDYFIAEPRGPYHGMFMEFKAPGGKLSTDQKDMGISLTQRDYHCVAVDSVDSADSALAFYLAL